MTSQVTITSVDATVTRSGGPVAVAGPVSSRDVSSIGPAAASRSTVGAVASPS